MEVDRVSKQGNEIYKVNIGKVDAIKKHYDKSDKDGFYVFGQVVIDGRIHQLQGNCFETQ